MPSSSGTIKKTNFDKAGLTRSSGVLSSCFKQLLWAVLLLAVLALILEITFRFAHIGEDEDVEFAPVIGFYHMPNKKITWRQEGFSEDRFNSAGMRDREFARTKAAGTKRIAIVGDSMTEAYQVPLEDTFVKRLERTLNDAGKHVEVMNFAMSGFSTIQELYIFKTKIKDYQPDLLILVYHIGDNEKNMAGAENMPRPYCFLDKDKQLRTDWQAYDQWVRSGKATQAKNTKWLKSESRLYGVLSRLDLQLSRLSFYKQVRDGWNSLLTGAEKLNAEKVNTEQLNQEKFGSDKLSTERLNQAQLGSDKLSTEQLNQVPSQSSTVRDILGNGSSQIADPVVLTEIGMKVNPPLAVSDSVSAWPALLQATSDRFKVTSAAINILNKACKQTKCEFAILGLPSNSGSALYFRELKGLEYQSKRDGFMFVDSNQFFPKIAPMEKSPLYYQVHFSKKGHALVANHLAEKIISSKCLD